MECDEEYDTVIAFEVSDAANRGAGFARGEIGIFFDVACRNISDAFYRIADDAGELAARSCDDDAGLCCNFCGFE